MNQAWETYRLPKKIPPTNFFKKSGRMIFAAGIKNRGFFLLGILLGTVF